jgi:protocatechuate 4,5-dioxygenase alpha chain
MTRKLLDVEKGTDHSVHGHSAKGIEVVRGGDRAVCPLFDTSDESIPGTYIFDGNAAMKGYALNKMCYSFNTAENRSEFLRDEDAYCSKYGLNEAQTKAIKDRNVLDLLRAGGNIYYLAKFTGIFHLTVQDVGAQQTGRTVEQFKQFIKSQGEN